MGIAKYLVSGSDLWLNTPRRPMEASGTSGMKAAINGVLNCSILDGWWAEGYHSSIGWAIGSGEFYEDEEQQDEIESKLLYDLLEREIIPLYYERSLDGLPREWIARMKGSMRELGPQFASHRMLMEYTDQFYRPALNDAQRIRSEQYSGAKELSAYVERLDEAWAEIEVTEPPRIPDRPLRVGEQVELSASVKLGSLAPEEVRVELYHGPMKSTGEIGSPSRSVMRPAGMPDKSGLCRFTGEITLAYAGRQGLTVRVLPHHEELVQPLLPGYLKWG